MCQLSNTTVVIHNHTSFKCYQLLDLSNINMGINTRERGRVRIFLLLRKLESVLWQVMNFLFLVKM